MRLIILLRSVSPLFFEHVSPAIAPQALGALNAKMRESLNSQIIHCSIDPLSDKLSCRTGRVSSRAESPLTWATRMCSIRNKPDQ